MTKFQSKNKYIVFWRTKGEEMPEAFENSLPFFATLLKMVEDNENVVSWGRCEGIVIESKYHFTGFVIFQNRTREQVIEEFGEYVEFTRIHKFTNTTETKEVLKHLKIYNH